MKNVSGKRFFMLVVLERTGSDRCGRSMWDCLCDCGVTTRVRSDNLTSGQTRSCGCLQIAQATTHGLTDTKTYRAWSAMLSRCKNENEPAFKDYGGRGISVCGRWKSFENFLSDMGESPSGLTLDRANNNGNYTPENCKWSTRKQQARNRRSNRLLTMNGVTLCAVEWAEKTGIKYSTIIGRMNRGWSVERTLEAS